MSDAENRSTDRVDYQTKVHLEFEKFSGFITEYSSNISEGGMFVKSKAPLPVGTIISFEFKLKDDFHLIQGLGEVTWVRSKAISADETTGMGIRFREISEQSRELIHTMVDNLRKAGKQPFDIDNIPDQAVTTAIDPGDVTAMMPEGGITGETLAMPGDLRSLQDDMDLPAVTRESALPSEDSLSDLFQAIKNQEDNPQTSSSIDLSDDSAFFDLSLGEEDEVPVLAPAPAPAKPVREKELKDDFEALFAIPEEPQDNEATRPMVAAAVPAPLPSSKLGSALESIEQKKASSAPVSFQSAATTASTYRHSGTGKSRWILVVLFFGLLFGLGFWFKNELLTGLGFRSQTPEPVALRPQSQLDLQQPTTSAVKEEPEALATGAEPGQNGETPSLSSAAPKEGEGTASDEAPSAPAESPQLNKDGVSDVTLEKVMPEKSPTPWEKAEQALGQPATSPPSLTHVSMVSWKSEGTLWTLMIEGGANLSSNPYEHLSLRDGKPREVIILKGINKGPGNKQYAVNHKDISRIRTGQHFDKALPEYHLVVDLLNPNIKLKEIGVQGSMLKAVFE